MAEEKQKNFQHLHGPYQTTGNIYKKQECCQAFVADASNPITMAGIVQTGVMHVVATGVVQDAYHD